DSPAAKALSDISPEITYRQLDISSEAGVEAFYEALAGNKIKVDVLVNNAGIILGKPLAETSTDEWKRLHDVNGLGTFMMLRGVLPFIDPTRGSIINVSSSAAIQPLKNLSAYSASKATINALTKAA